MIKLTRSFYMQETALVAKALLGKTLIHNIDGNLLKGIITETEAYLGINDKAAHSYGGKRTARTEVMFGKGGVSYVYLIYGIYYCFNVVVKEEGVPEAVLIRSVSPLQESLNSMAQNRYKKMWFALSASMQKNITNGPGKLSAAFKFDKTSNGIDLTGNKIYIEDSNFTGEICISKRIGIDYAEEDKDKLLRFYLKPGTIR